MVPNTRSQDKVSEESQTVLDLRATDARHRSSDMEKIIKEMEIGNNESFRRDTRNEKDSNNDNSEDDLLALIDSVL